MSKCSNCGAELEAGMKFCGECGTPVPQVKKCINCGTELPFKMKFCFECGASQEGASAGAGVNMGDKNVVAGDVVSQKVTGDNVQSKILGNAIYNTFQDDTKQLKKCHICGGMFSLGEGYFCPECNEFTCNGCYDTERKLCKRCTPVIQKKNEDKYKDAIRNALQDGGIDFSKRSVLKLLQEHLGINDKTADTLEKSIKLSRIQAADTLTKIENINLGKAVEFFYEKGDTEKAYQLIEPIYKAHPEEERVLDTYLPILVRHDVNQAKQTMQSLRVDCLALYTAEIEIALQESRLDIVEKKVRQGKVLWPDNEILKYYEALLYIRLAFESGDWNYIQETNRVAESFTETDNKIERTLQAKMRKVLAALNGTPAPEKSEKDLYKALYSRDIGIKEISVGPQKRIKSIQQAINAVDAGGTISVDAGLYREHLEFSKNLKLVGVRSSILKKSSDSLPIIVLDSDKTCKLSKPVEIEGVVFTHNAGLSFDNLNEYARSDRQFEDEHGYFNYGDEGWNSLLWVESDSVLSNVGVLDSENYGITFSRNNAKVINSVVSRCYDNCVYCVKNSNVVISESVISCSNHPGVIVMENSRPTVSKCEIFGHLSDGIGEKDNACGTYSGCDIYGNGGCGVEVQDSASGSFGNCHVHDNKWNGFNVSGESTPKIENCKIHDNKPDSKCEMLSLLCHGIWEKDNASGTYSGCDIYGNGGCGVEVQDSASGSFGNCHVHDNKGEGFNVSGESTPKIENCKIHDNKKNGFNVSGESTPKIENCKIHDNKTEGEKYPGVVARENSRPTVFKCEIFGHLSYGIWEKDNTSGTYSGCDIYGNGGCGVGVWDSASGFFGNCHVHDNKASGFSVSGESTPKIENSKIHDNKTEGKNYPGVVAKENSRPTVSKCEIFGHLGNGISEKDNASGTYSGCDIHDNKGNGFDVQGESTPKIENSKIHDNKTEGVHYSGVVACENSRPTVSKCEIFGHLSNGISETDNASGTYSGCDIHDNKGNGFNVSGESTPKIENCKIHDNKTEGKKHPGVVARENSRPTVSKCEIFGHLSYGIWEKDNASGTYSSCNIHDNSGMEICKGH